MLLGSAFSLLHLELVHMHVLIRAIVCLQYDDVTYVYDDVTYDVLSYVCR